MKDPQCQIGNTSRELSHPTLTRGKSSSNNMPYQGDMLIPWRVHPGTSSNGPFSIAILGLPEVNSVDSLGFFSRYSDSKQNRNPTLRCPNRRQKHQLFGPTVKYLFEHENLPDDDIPKVERNQSFDVVGHFWKNK